MVLVSPFSAVTVMRSASGALTSTVSVREVERVLPVPSMVTRAWLSAAVAVRVTLLALFGRVRVYVRAAGSNAGERVPALAVRVARSALVLRRSGVQLGLR